MLQGRTPLWLASDVGHADSVEALLKARADKNSAAFLRPTKSFRGVRSSSTPEPSLSSMIAMQTHSASTVSCYVLHRLYSSPVC